MKNIEQLMLENKAYSFEKKEVNPNYFVDLALDQKPQFLWIGCSDSRVSPDDITNSKPGYLFVQRNIANMVQDDDNNLQSVIYFALNYLKVDSIILCGHYECGGVKSAMSLKSFGYLDRWLEPIKKIYLAHESELKVLDEKTASKRMVEINIDQQVKNLAKNQYVMEKWNRGEKLLIHALVYDLNSGQLKKLNTVSGPIKN